MSVRPTTRRGIALLLVLATLVLAVSAAAGLARAATAARLRAASDRDRRAADALLDACEAPILDWLRRHSVRVALPPDAASPRFTLLDDSLDIAGTPCRLTITAFDECGMRPPGWRGAEIPADVAERIASAGEAFRARPGLDLLTGSGERQVFPAGADSRGGALGELVATHNPPLRSERSNRQAAININTAPIALVAAVYADRGISGVEAVMEARGAGRVASPGASTAPRSDERLPVPVAASTSWAFRIDCRAGRVCRSWWRVYADTGSNWERIQTLAITE